MVEANFKRKAIAAHPSERSKRLRTDDSRSSLKSKSNNNEDDESSHSFSDSSDYSDREGTESPVTQESYSPKKFPSQIKNIKCTYDNCDKTFNRPAKLAAHLRSHTNERPFICTYTGCDKAYLQLKHLQHHIKSSHTSERNFHCEWEGCGKAFLTSTRLKRHHKVHEGSKQFKCTNYPPCSQNFRKHQTLQRHIRSEHLQLMPYPCVHVDPVTGESCNSGFDSSASLRRHQERAHGSARYFCNECCLTGSFNSDGTPLNLGFTSYSKLQAHIRKEHAECMFCNIKFRSERELLSHVDSIHSGKSLEERQIFCCNEPGCNKRFTSKYNLNTHVKIAHLGNRYICGTFDLGTELEGYEWSNLNGCGGDFSSKKNLLNHILTVHLKIQTLKSRRNKNASQKIVTNNETNTQIIEFS
ncbi:Transcription factor IIIA [Erysiphe necator]|uniref:Putative c2h2 type zinc finger containing protein n=1 Tax=Uncinula necator TaxID=52586 RepID=A0A0B1P191_UNCNE|nr:Transcription factor IIIA [Erysiphe necator]KHJ31060.1 putative c2h2 type zinc finger containing protein [Erysiphe necator]